MRAFMCCSRRRMLVRRRDVLLPIDNGNDTVFRCRRHSHYPIKDDYAAAIVEYHDSDVYTDRHPSYIRVLFIIGNSSLVGMGYCIKDVRKRHDS